MLVAKNIKLLVVHCSDSDDSKTLTAFDLHKMHLNFGWDGIGYHKIINRSGKIENGRPEYWVGAHVKGKNNISLGVCLIGRHKFTRKHSGIFDVSHMGQLFIYGGEKLTIELEKIFPLDLKRLKLKRLITKNVNYLIANKQITNKKLMFVGKSNKVWLYKLRSISKINISK